MRDFIAKVGRAFPGIGPAVENALNPKTDLNALRRAIWQSRTEFWIRKTLDAPGTWQAAKPEARALLQQLKSPGTITYRQVAEGGVWALQLFGCFVIGEMYGRGSIIGYDVGGPNPYHDKVHEH